MFRSPEAQPAFNPKNCGAVTGQLLGLVTSKTANEMTKLGQGSYPEEWVNYISTTVGSPVKLKVYPFSTLESFFQANLFPGFGTSIAMYPESGSGHWFIVAKSRENRLVILDPQTRKGYFDVQSYVSTGGWVPTRFFVFLRNTPRSEKEHDADYLGFLAKALEICDFSSIVEMEVEPPRQEDIVMEGTGRRKRRKTRRRLVAKRTLRRMNRRRRIL
jgi:hypothetical protein